MDYIKKILADNGDNPSMKRVVTMICALLIATGYIANLFWRFTIDEFIFNSVMYIVIAGFGFTGVEKFAPKAPTTSE